MKHIWDTIKLWFASGAIIAAQRERIKALEFDLEWEREGYQRAMIELERTRMAKDGAYEERNKLVAAFASFYKAGTKRTDIPGWSPDWHGCVFIDTPDGQMSWHYHDSHQWMFAHLPPYDGEWDGHTTAQKYERLQAMIYRRYE